MNALDERIGQLMTEHKETLARMVAGMEQDTGVLLARIAATKAARPAGVSPTRSKVSLPVRVVPRELAITPRGKK